MILAIDRTRSLRGALSGAVAAAAWVAEQPLDKRLLDCGYDDVELLGKAVTRGAGWFPAGLAMHLANGALFGAAYANVRRALPLPDPLCGPAAALAEHLALWPLVAVTDRFHPARKELPVLSGSRAAFTQAAIRHLLFGLVLGELERRLNAEPDPEPPVAAPGYSSNGHVNLEDAGLGATL